MGLFSRKSSAPAESRLPAPEETAAAGRALARGNQKPADRLVTEAGEYGQSVAMQILADSLDYTPQD
ncbi:hypothetical protein AB0G79_00825 [Streptomyces sp. NPDC020807]|uniref:hypothetical protein n=1 Tax=Streptomyces sp. NPDC020807 TaxID=3155119 RepID=UPI0033DC9CAC